jgi:hypothetical protein
MVKMASAIKQQKPGKTRGKNDNAEKFITAAQEATDTSKQLMTDIKAIPQETNMGKSQQGTREQNSRDLRKASTEASPTKGVKTNKDQKFWFKLGNTTGETSLHPGKGRVGDLYLENETNNIRQKVSNLKEGQQCRNERRAAMPLKTTGSHQKVCIHVSMVSLVAPRL